MSDTANPQQQQTGQEPEDKTPQPGTDEYNRIMADRFKNGGDQGGNNDPEKPLVDPIPEGGHEKFYNADTGAYDWANHARELQYRLDQVKTTGEEPKPKEGEGDEPKPKEGDDDNAASDIVSRAGLDPSALEAKISNGQDFSDAEYAALEKQGVTREMADNYVAGLRAQAETVAKEAMDYAGGKETWDQVKSWAQQNLSQEEMRSYQDQLGSPNWRMAVDSLKTRADAASPTNGEPSLVSGNQSRPNSSGYRSRAEMKRDMSDPRYSSDPAFRQQVMQKMRNASWELEGQF